MAVMLRRAALKADASLLEARAVLQDEWENQNPEWADCQTLLQQSRVF